MKAIKAIITILPLCMAMLLIGCTKDAVVEIYNNTGSIIQIEFAGKRSIVLNLNSLVLSYDSLAKGIVIEKNGKASRYKFPLLDRNDTYASWRHASKDLLRAQLDSNGSIFVTGPHVKLPVTSHANQPRGFPVKPAIE